MSGIGGRAPATCAAREGDTPLPHSGLEDRKSTRLNSSHSQISYAVFCLKKKKQEHEIVALHSSTVLYAFATSLVLLHTLQTASSVCVRSWFRLSTPVVDKLIHHRVDWL